MSPKEWCQTLTFASHHIFQVGLHMFAYLCYQHASNTKAEAETLRKRAHFWQKLASLLSSIPRRHLLLMLGDFNTPLDATCLDIHGPCVPEAKHSAPADVPDFTALLKAHQLLALNTHRKDSVGTYKPYLGEDSFTQIDFIFTRGCTADATAKQAWTLKHFPLQAHLKGFFDLPIRASVPSVVHVRTKPKTSGREGRPLEARYHDGMFTKPRSAGTVQSGRAHCLVTKS